MGRGDGVGVSNQEQLKNERVAHVGVYRDHARRGWSMCVVVQNDEGVEQLAKLDGTRVSFEDQRHMNHVTLEIGDKLLIEGTGAYTSTYSSVAFNGIPPLKTYHI